MIQLVNNKPEGRKGKMVRPVDQTGKGFVKNSTLHVVSVLSITTYQNYIGGSKE